MPHTTSKVFLVDDQAIANFINRKILEMANFCDEIIAFTNPKLAFDEIEKHQPDVILLDLNMPQISGWDFLELMRNNGVTTKVVILTSSTSEIDRKFALSQKEVSDYVIKPLTFDSLRGIEEKMAKVS